ncbi:MAG: transposase [Rhodobacteraceae bacterium]|nr:transposase [Paracoccaceae bacterium]
MSHLTLPSAAAPLLESFAAGFSKPTFSRFLVLLVGAVLALGRRTVTNIFWTVRGVAEGDVSSYHRVLSRAKWSLWPLAKIVATRVIALLPKDQPVGVAGDDTPQQRKGKKVYGKARHRDPIRSTHAHTVWLYGHKWVVLAILVKLPCCSRYWALPVLAALYRDKKTNEAEKRRHKTPTDLMRQMLAVLMHWFPQRKFTFCGDGGFASHELARFCHRHRQHITLVSRFHPKANLYEAAPPRKTKQQGRPRVKGKKLPTPQEAVATGTMKKATVDWYGGQERLVGLISGEGHWYKSGQGLVPVRWVHVKDLDGTHRDDWLYTTDPTLAADAIVSFFTRRWSIEVTFEESRAHLGLGTERNRCEASVLRSTPCLMGLFSVVVLIYAEHLRGHKPAVRVTPWYEKDEPTFADALGTIRRLLWSSLFLKDPSVERAWKSLPAQLRDAVFDRLCYVA